MSGKGDKPRPVDIKQYETKYDQIDWKRKVAEDKKRK